MAISIARTERAELCDLLDRLGPDAATILDGWRTRDLAAHLVMREGRPTAAVSLALPLFCGHAERVHDAYTAWDWPDLLRTLRTGPPRWSLFALPGVDARANLVEMYVHHEDVRRAQPNWQPRDADAERYRALERALMKTARLLLRRCPLTVRLDPGTGQPFVARSDKRPGSVTVVGSPDELMLWCFGRDEHARVELIGTASDVAAATGAPRGV